MSRGVLPLFVAFRLRLFLFLQALSCAFLPTDFNLLHWKSRFCCHSVWPVIASKIFSSSNQCPPLHWNIKTFLLAYACLASLYVHKFAFLRATSPFSLSAEIISVTFLGRTKSASKPAFSANCDIESEFQCYDSEKVTQTTFFGISQNLAFSREISQIRSALPSDVKHRAEIVARL